MTATYEALKKAEAEKESQFNSSLGRNGQEAADSCWDNGVPNRLEYEKIRVWLTHPAGLDQRLRTAMVVGCQSGTGTTTTAALLAASLAEAKNSRVLIVDGNFRTPALNRLFQLKNNGGFSEVVSKGLPFEAQTQPTNRQNLLVLPSGQAPIVPAELFEGEAMKQFLSQLKKAFDFVIFDAAPLLQFPDAYALAPSVDGVIIVIEAEKTSIEDAQRVKRNLEQVGARILGVVLNRQRDYTPVFLRKLFNNGIEQKYH
jgi:capsular exopolysaccharide synthesis family protein